MFGSYYSSWSERGEREKESEKERNHCGEGVRAIVEEKDE